MGRAEQITKAVKSYDSKLYCEKSREGKLCVYRRGSRIEPYDIDGLAINFVRPAPHFVFALTHDWKLAGRPVDWGVLPIMNRLKAIDLWQRDLAEESIKSVERASESYQRDMGNSIESFLYDFRSSFKKATADINTASMKKIDRRRKDESKYGNSK